MLSEKSVQAVVLAAGCSKRFKRSQTKLLTHICGRSMIMFPLNVLQDLSIPTTIVLGHQADAIQKEVDRANPKNISYVMQSEQLGTGNAVLCSREKWNSDNILIINADVPLLNSKLIKELLVSHDKSQAEVSLLSTYVMDPKGYGRIIEQEGSIKIVEEKDCSGDAKEINKVNAGIYVVKRSFLEKHIDMLESNNAGREFYLTDLVAMASDHEFGVNLVPVPFDQVRGVNTLQELWAVEQVTRSGVIRYWMKNGVRFELAQSIHIDLDVEIGEGSFIGTGVHLLGKTKVGSDCFISAFTIIENTIIGDASTIHSHSVLQDSVIGKEVHAGPFARLRNGVSVGDFANIGNFVEVKNSSIGERSKTKHLSYVGDATIGKNVNIGAGTIFCNYDGKQKNRSILEDDVFVGSNSSIVAPVKIGQESYVAAGSTVTKDVPSKSLAIGRARQENKVGYVKKMHKKNEKSEPKKNNDVAFNFLGATKPKGMTKEGI